MRLVAAGDVDLAVVTGQETPRGASRTQHLFDQPFVWVGPRRGRRDREPLTERLRREPLLRLAAGEPRARGCSTSISREERIRPVSTIDVPSVSLLLSYVSGGLGIGLVPALALAEAPAGRVVSAPARCARAAGRAGLARGRPPSARAGPADRAARRGRRARRGAPARWRRAARPSLRLSRGSGKPPVGRIGVGYHGGPAVVR